LGEEGFRKFQNVPVLMQQFNDLIDTMVVSLKSFIDRPLAGAVRTTILRSDIFRTFLESMGRPLQPGEQLPSQKEFVEKVSSNITDEPSSADLEMIAQQHTLIVDLRQFTSDPRLSNADANRIIRGLTSFFSSPRFGIRQLLSTQRQIIRRWNQQLKTARRVTRLPDPLGFTELTPRKFEDVVKSDPDELLSITP